jgi:hypothetical protein
MSRGISARRGRAWTRPAATAAIAVVLAAVLIVPAAAKTTLRKTKTFTLHAHTTKTFNVAYPAALKYKGAKYGCTVVVSGPGKSGVKILSKGSALGGSVCRVKARNSNKFEDPLEDAKLKITATTTYCAHPVRRRLFATEPSAVPTWAPSPVARAALLLGRERRPARGATRSPTSCCRRRSASGRTRPDHPPYARPVRRCRASGPARSPRTRARLRPR